MKILKIIKAFSGNYQKHRWHIEREGVCKKCNFYSRNRKLSWIKRLREKVLKGAFCLKCSCQIYEKTALDTEECPLRKWGRIRLILNSKRIMNIYNLQPMSVTVYSNERTGDVVIDAGVLKAGIISFVLDFTGKSYAGFEQIRGCCGINPVPTVEDGERVRVDVNIEKQKAGFHNKQLVVVYKNSVREKIEEIIKLKYTVK